MKIEIIETKELKSTTSVEGKLIRTNDKKWYGIARMCPPRDSWYIRAFHSSATGKLGKEIFMKQTFSKPDFEYGINLLLEFLNEGKNIESDKFRN